MSKIKIRYKAPSRMFGFFRYHVEIAGLKYPRKRGEYYLALTDQEAIDEAKQEAEVLVRAEGRW